MSKRKTPGHSSGVRSEYYEIVWYSRNQNPLISISSSILLPNFPQFSPVLTEHVLVQSDSCTRYFEACSPDDHVQLVFSTVGCEETFLAHSDDGRRNEFDVVTCERG